MVVRKNLRFFDTLQSRGVELQRRKQSFTLLAQNEDWLAHNFDKIIHAQDVHPQDDDSVKPAAAKITGEPRGS